MFLKWYPAYVGFILYTRLLTVYIDVFCADIAKRFLRNVVYYRVKRRIEHNPIFIVVRVPCGVNSA